MNTSSNVMSEMPLDRSEAAPAAMPAIRLLYWSVRRELWENRSIYIAPLAVGAVALIGYLISVLSGRLALGSTHHQQAMTMPYDFAAGALMLTTMAVGVFYSIDALHGERLDRSILFWKSLPVSDLTTVFSKAIIPIFLVQFLGFAITVVLQILMLTLGSVAMLGRGQNPAALWPGVSFFEMFLLLFYHLFTVHMLWHAPIYSWLLLASAWAKRLPLLWAVLPPLAIGVLERIVFNTSYFVSLIGRRFAGGAEAMSMGQVMPIHPGIHLTPGRFLGAPGLWAGLIIAAAFLVAAARLRRYRGPI